MRLQHRPAVLLVMKTHPCRASSGRSTFAARPPNRFGQIAWMQRSSQTSISARLGNEAARKAGSGSVWVETPKLEAFEVLCQSQATPEHALGLPHDLSALTSDLLDLRALSLLGRRPCMLD